MLESSGKENVGAAEAKLSEIAAIESTHHRIVASYACTVRRCFGYIAEGRRRERVRWATEFGRAGK